MHPLLVYMAINMFILKKNCFKQYPIGVPWLETIAELFFETPSHKELCVELCYKGP